MMESTKHSIEHPKEFIEQNREMLNDYLALKQSLEYQQSPAAKLQALLKQFNQSSGSYDKFIPAMKQLSKSYAAYYQQMEKANEELLFAYPEINQLEL